MKKSERKPRYIDLFAGCGGLSLGLEAAGFAPVFALERSPDAAATYYHNFIESIENHRDWYQSYANGHSDLDHLHRQLENRLVVMDIRRVVELINSDEKGDLREYFSDIDLIAGGPPCQGFSVAGRRNPGDERNTLAGQFLEIVKRVQPKFVLVENVEGMARKFNGRDNGSPLYGIASALGQLGYDVQPMLLNAKYFGVPQNRSRVFILGERNTTDESVVHSLYKQSSNASVEPPKLLPTIIDANFTVKDALQDLKKKRAQPRSYYTEALNEDLGRVAAHRALEGDDTPANHKFRRHSEKTSSRFKVLQILKGFGLHKDLLYWAATDNDDKISSEISRHACRMDEVIEALENDPVVAAHIRLDRRKKSVTARFRQVLDQVSSKKHSQKVLDRDSVSSTIMTIPDDYVHYAEPRVLTVREEARLQSFPDTFEFKGKETTGGKLRGQEVPQYTQVGNAVPPKLAKALGETIARRLRE